MKTDEVRTVDDLKTDVVTVVRITGLEKGTDEELNDEVTCLLDTATDGVIDGLLDSTTV